MQKNYASAVFDRKKQLKTKGVGKVEILICLSRTVKKYITMKSCTEKEWKFYQSSIELAKELSMYNTIAQELHNSGDEITIYNFNLRIGQGEEAKAEMEKAKLMASPTGFIDFVKEEIEKEKCAPGTLRRKMVAYRALKSWGKMNRFSQVTDTNVYLFDEMLQEDNTRTRVTIHNYHKTIKKCTRIAYDKGLIKVDPYKSTRCKFNRGKSKERRPLIEAELKRIRNLKGLSDKLEKARDIFVFSAYTGLAYSDNQAFDFETMTEKHGKTYYIDGGRIKNDNIFYTPILPPAMEILEKYDYQLPKLSNQKLNDYLKVIKELAKINKPMTSHVARHSFATLSLTYDIPIENVSRMMGHKDIKTTQIYAKILKKNVEKKVNKMAGKIR